MENQRSENSETQDGVGGEQAQALPGETPVQSSSDLVDIDLPCAPSDLKEYGRLEEWVQLRAVLRDEKNGGLRQVLSHHATEPCQKKQFKIMSPLES